MEKEGKQSCDPSDCSDSDGGSGHSTARSTNTATSGGSSGAEEEFVRKETRRVFLLRLVVVAALLAAAAAVSVCVFLITDVGEEQEYESQYESAADKVTDAFLSIAREKMGAAGSLVVALVAHGVDHTRQWPFVALSSFQQRARTTKTQAGALRIETNPIVWREDREMWEDYTQFDPDRMWYQEGRQYQMDLGIDDIDTQPQVETDDPDLDLSSGIASHIYNFRRDDPSKAMVSPKKPFYLPAWQTSPVTKRTIVNQNRASTSDGILTCLQEDAVVFEGMQSAEPGYQDSPDPVTSEIAWLLRLDAGGKKTKYEGDIFTTVYFPLYDNFGKERSTVGVMSVLIHWAKYFQGILPESMKGIVFVLDDGCDEPYTYMINGEDVVPIGRGDLHNPSYDHMERSASFLEVTKIEDGTKRGLTLNHEKCPYSVRVYPSTEFYKQYNTSMPIIITFAVGGVFIFTVIMFAVYDRLVEKRQQLIMRQAKQTHDIVAAMFPKNVRARLIKEHEEKRRMEEEGGGRIASGTNRLKSFLANGDDANGSSGLAAPIADLFPSCTVFFSDIAGFTAWSSTREPAQVFILLQNLYQAYDTIAKRRKVFKVETIGDAYVAVAGCPDPMERHAVVMARFAAECNIKTMEICHKLESTLGPGTGDLSIRIGLHSGPVTAGVLMGEKARFQLFGDTVNTAARMESTGKSGLIQVSKDTADLLTAAGKGHWVMPREDDVHAKGKGVLKTFWVSPHVKAGSANGSRSAGSFTGSSMSSSERNSELEEVKTWEAKERHTDWVVELLMDSIKKIKARQKAMNMTHTSLAVPEQQPGKTSIDEVVESFKLPSFDAKVASECLAKEDSVEVCDKLKGLLREYVSSIAAGYRDNPFHSFEHACHVVMSVNKFMRRIVSPDFDVDSAKCGTESKDSSELAIASHIHHYTHGINSDPITIFAILFSALIHDVDHRGVSNVQMMKEEPDMAEYFRHQSVAEQNSLEYAWNLLVSDRFKPLLSSIFASNDELFRFRQVVVNVVLATDIFDKKLGELRQMRWDKGFTMDMDEEEVAAANTNDLKATVVIELLMQASDVCHTMQHWHIYRKWNKQLFHEMLLAYRAGRLGADPAKFWFQGELNFFDSYIIPLAKKLQDCRVFGVSSDECLAYANRNRGEWEAKGQQIVKEMKEEFEHSVLIAELEKMVEEEG